MAPSMVKVLSIIGIVSMVTVSLTLAIVSGIFSSGISGKYIWFKVWISSNSNLTEAPAYSSIVPPEYEPV